MIDISQITNQFIRERRHTHFPGYVREEFDALVRYVPDHFDTPGFVCFTNTTEESVRDLIQKQISFFHHQVSSFEWKFYEFDQPKNLEVTLQECGFQGGESELFLFRPVTLLDNVNFAQNKELVVEQIQKVEELNEIVAFQEMIYQRDLPWLQSNLTACFDNMRFIVIRDNGKIIGSSWMEFFSDSDFADLHGGAIHPLYRGKGMYSILLNERLKIAKDLGLKYVCADAGPLSKPILLAKDFIPLCRTTPYTYHFKEIG